MCKMLIVCLTAFILIATLIACTSNGASGKVENVEISIGTSYKFSTEEIEEAINLVKERFVSSYKGCELLQLWYAEIRSEREIDSYMQSGRGRTNGVCRENVIVLFSTFSTSSNVCMTLNQNSIYEGWSWVLIRDNENEPWRIDDVGW